MDKSNPPPKAKKPPPPPEKETETDPNCVTHPVRSIITKTLTRTWVMEPHRQMCIRFDVVNPLMQFKKGTTQNDDDQFPRYDPSPEEDPNVTEVDGSAQPYEPLLPEWYALSSSPPCTTPLTQTTPSSRWYTWDVDLPLARFMEWSEGELIQVEYGVMKKVPRKRAWKLVNVKKMIPVPYARLVHQFCLEILQGEVNSSHEAVRRMGYAQRMLDAFGKELEGFKGDKSKFRSKTFTPVLQRQLRGLPDNFAPPLKAFLCQRRPGKKKPTINEATSFYLAADPISPEFIPWYCRNLIYIREAAWHLGILMGQAAADSIQDFEQSIHHHGLVLAGLKEPDDPDRFEEGNPIPRLTSTEVTAIFCQSLELYFEPELLRVVRACKPTTTSEH